MKRIAALALAVGLCTPYSCDVRPVATLWDWDSAVVLILVGIPVLAAIAYVLHTLVPFATRFHARHGVVLHRLLRGLFLLLVAGWLISSALESWDEPDFWALLLPAVAFTCGLFLWSRRRGTEADRLPLLMLAILGLPAIFYFLSEVKSLQYGGWIFSAGYALAVILEARDLRKTPTGGGVAPP
jgi:uncharacterized membrane protein YfcA